MQQYFLFLIITTIIFCNSVYCTTEADCTNRTNTDCKTCVAINRCAYCKPTKKCFYVDSIPLPCDTSDMQLETCVEMFEGVCGFQWEMFEYYRSFRVWIIIVAVLGGIILLTVLIVLCCFCRKCKQCRIRKVERRQQEDNQRMEERRAAAEIRTTERNLVADKIRMKYGILKEKETGTDYARMS